MKRNIIPILWLLICTSLFWINAAQADQLESIQQNIEDIGELYQRQSTLNDNQINLNKLINRLAKELHKKDELLEQCMSDLRDVVEQLRVTKEIAVALRSDTFNIKANMTQLEGELSELRKERDKSWWK